MNINTKNRTELKQFFLKNETPTEEEFADLIDANLNKAEDGIAKAQGSPLALQAEGEEEGPQDILGLYANFGPGNPDWSLNLNPRVDPQQPESNQPGLNIKDATGESRLFIKAGNGNVGIGTVEPNTKLAVEGTVTARGVQSTGFLTVGSNATVNNQLNVQGKVAFANELTVQKRAFFKDRLDVDGFGFFKGDLTVNNNFFVRKDVSIDNKLTVQASAFFNKNISVQGRMIAPESQVVSFSVSLGTNKHGAINPLGFSQNNYNHGGHFKDKKHFIAPVKGLYLFTMCLRQNTNDGVAWLLRLNGTGYVNGGGTTNNEKVERSMLYCQTKFETNTRTVISKLNKNDKVHIQQIGSGGSDNYASGFEGVLLQAFE